MTKYKAYFCLANGGKLKHIMNKLSLTELYSVEELAQELHFDTKLENGIRTNFGDPISINELKKITKRKFLDCKWFGLKSWQQFQKGLSEFCISDQAVALVNQPNMDNIIVEIDTSRPFKEVIAGLAKIMEQRGITSKY